ncbi:Golgi-associated plant pathogenesis-related protein 1 [Hydra vulgaris]|uniref:Golgi-associated plant pathogenesis-related protein 1 n=1 Tax=Hydra vulgaris TaxID=6087 RepID=A0ABM4CV74_HYDVU
MSLKTEALNRHNEYRKKHGVCALTWSAKLHSSAQNWANNLAKKGYLQHEEQDLYGENIAVMKGSELTGDKATDMWYNEIKDYNFNNPGYNSKTGHFTQVVWADSKEFGIAKAVSSNGTEFVVARYFPPGNSLQMFKENVKPLTKTPSNKENEPMRKKPLEANPQLTKQSKKSEKRDCIIL